MTIWHNHYSLLAESVNNNEWDESIGTLGMYYRTIFNKTVWGKKTLCLQLPWRQLNLCGTTVYRSRVDPFGV
jgi:hypothetical protein